MSVNVSIEGMEEILNRIDQMGKSANKIVNDTLKKAGAPILKDAKGRAPVKTGKGRDGLKISGVKTKNGVKYVQVGILKGDNSEIFYMKFSEWGTSRQLARPFLEPAYLENRENVKQIIKQSLKEGLGL